MAVLGGSLNAESAYQRDWADILSQLYLGLLATPKRFESEGSNAEDSLASTLGVCKTAYVKLKWQLMKFFS